MYYVGLAYRLCLPNATWDMVINNTECQNDKLEMLFSLLSDVSGNSSGLIENIDKIEAISKGISDFTNVSTGISPNELSTANDIISVLTRLEVYVSTCGCILQYKILMENTEESNNC